jgi:hypothetical protein
LSHVLSLVSQNQVLRVEAGRVVAQVEYPLTVGDWSNEFPICDAMSRRDFSTGVPFQLNAAIATDVAIAGPFPTARFGNSPMLKQAFLQRLAVPVASAAVATSTCEKAITANLAHGATITATDDEPPNALGKALLSERGGDDRPRPEP